MGGNSSAEGNPNAISVTFEPGEIGFEQKHGKVLSVHRGKQGERVGAQAGWKLVGVRQDCNRFEDKLFVDARNGKAPYKVWFVDANSECIGVTLQPGVVGVTQLNGEVISVVAGAQAERVGVRPGWRLIAIGQKCSRFEDKLFLNAKNGNAPYHVTFLKGRSIGEDGKGSIDPSTSEFPSIVVAALDPHKQLDFPCVTEICDKAAQFPADADAGIAILTATLGEQTVKSGDARNITQDYYKALTIIHEMLYNERIVEMLRSTPGLAPALERLKNFSGSDKGESVDGTIRMLANEIGKTVFRDDQG